MKKITIIFVLLFFIFTSCSAQQQCGQPQSVPSPVVRYEVTSQVPGYSNVFWIQEIHQDGSYILMKGEVAGENPEMAQKAARDLHDMLYHKNCFSKAHANAMTDVTRGAYGYVTTGKVSVLVSREGVLENGHLLIAIAEPVVTM